MSGEMLSLAFSPAGAAAKWDSCYDDQPFFDVWSADGWIDGVVGITDVEVACERLGIDPTALVDVSHEPQPRPYSAAWLFPAEALR